MMFLIGFSSTEGLGTANKIGKLNQTQMNSVSDPIYSRFQPSEPPLPQSLMKVRNQVILWYKEGNLDQQNKIYRFIDKCIAEAISVGIINEPLLAAILLHDIINVTNKTELDIINALKHTSLISKTNHVMRLLYALTYVPSLKHNEHMLDIHALWHNDQAWICKLCCIIGRIKWLMQLGDAIHAVDIHEYGILKNKLYRTTYNESPIYKLQTTLSNLFNDYM